MKNIAIAILFALGLSATAQVNQNVTKETKKTTVTIDNGTEKKKLVKTESTNAQQDIEFENAESDKLNKDIKQTPVQVTSSTTISGDGIPTQQVSRSGYYMMNGQRYQMINDNTGYRMSSDSNKNLGVLRRTSNNNYIYKTKDRTSVGYFDKDGNFVVETWNDNADGLTVETYSIVKP